MGHGGDGTFDVKLKAIFETIVNSLKLACKAFLIWNYMSEFHFEF